MLLKSRCTPWKTLITRPASVVPIRHKFRRASPVLKEARIEDGPALQTIQRVSYLIFQGEPAAAMGYFNKRMSSKNEKTPERAHIFEAVLDLLLRENCFDQVEKVHAKMDKEGMHLSSAVRAKLLAARFVKGLTPMGEFLDGLHQLFSSSSMGIGGWHFHDILSQVLKTDGCVENCEKILEVYLKTKGPNYRLDPLLVTFMIGLHMKAGNRGDAQHWLEHHSSRPSLVEPEPRMLYPYTTYINYLALTISPEEDPKDHYARVLQQITDAGLNADTALVNTLIAMELKHGRPNIAAEFYIALQETLSFKTYPDAVTFVQLFTASGRAAIDAHRTQNIGSKGSAKPFQPFPIPSRALFRDMLSLHTLQTAGELASPPEHTPVLTTSSLGQALWQFTAAQDYAAACVALRVYVTQRVPVEADPVFGSVTSALLEHCRREIRLSRNDGGGRRGFTGSESEGSAWVSTFLNLRRLAPWRLKGELPRETERRMVGAAKRDLILNALSAVAKRAEADAEKGEDGSGTYRVGLGLNELEFRRRVRRLRLVDAMLTRALAASFMNERRTATPAEMRKAAEQAIARATEEMVPVDGFLAHTDSGGSADGEDSKKDGYSIQQSIIEGDKSEESDAHR